MPSVPEGPGTLYVCYDRDGEIIWIGATTDIRARLDYHGRHPEESPWWPEVVWVDTYEFDDIHEAREREAAAIQSVRPTYNEQWKHRTDGPHMVRASTGSNRRRFKR